MDTKLLDEYKNNNLKIFNAFNIPTKLSKLEITSMLASQNDGIVSSQDIPMDNIKGRIEIPWYNGNYIVWNTGMAKETYFSAEFDKNRHEAGFLVILEPELNENFIICY